MIRKIKVAYVCVHNSCRSQMAEALTKLYFSDRLEAYSAGTEMKPKINQDAVRIIKQLHNVDMNETQHSKLIDDLPEIDIVVTMGCNVECPWLPCQFREDWGLDDPSGLPDDAFIQTQSIIQEKIKSLIDRLDNQEITIK
jgi:arsenate reductase (thioredoxin)